MRIKVNLKNTLATLGLTAVAATSIMGYFTYNKPEFKSYFGSYEEMMDSAPFGYKIVEYDFDYWFQPSNYEYQTTKGIKYTTRGEFENGDEIITTTYYGGLVYENIFSKEETTIEVSFEEEEIIIKASFKEVR